MNTLIIDRAKWRNSRYRAMDPKYGPTQLLNEQGFRCCLGFHCSQAGIRDDLLLEKQYPSSLLSFCPPTNLPQILIDKGRDS